MKIAMWILVGAVVGQFLGLLVLIARLMWEDYCDARDCKRMQDMIRRAWRV